jgi:hypothetical protein
MLAGGKTTETEVMSGRKKHEVDLFYEALGRADPAARAAFLERACAGQTALRERLERLLAIHGEAEKFFVQEEPAIISQENTRQKQ